jgi:hypothetical protein
MGGVLIAGVWSWCTVCFWKLMDDIQTLKRLIKIMNQGILFLHEAITELYQRNPGKKGVLLNSIRQGERVRSALIVLQN